MNGNGNEEERCPYSAAITGGGFLYEESGVLLPLLRADCREALLREEALDDNLLHINAEKSRKTNIREIVRLTTSKTTWRVTG